MTENSPQPKWHQRQIDLVTPFRAFVTWVKSWRRKPQPIPERSNYLSYRPIAAPSPEIYDTWHHLAVIPSSPPSVLPESSCIRSGVVPMVVSPVVQTTGVWMPPIGWAPSGDQGLYVGLSGVNGYTYRRKPRLFPDEADSTGPH